MKQKLRHFLLNPTYYQRLVLSHLLVLVLTAAIMAAFNYASSRSVQSERMLDLVGYSGQQTAASIEARFLQMQNVSEMVRYTLQQLLGQSTQQTPKPQADAEAINTLKTLRDAFGFCDITAWMPESCFSADEGITFFNINRPDGRVRQQEVLGAPYNKLTWIAQENYRYPFMRFASTDTRDILSCFIHVSTLSTPSAFCFFIDVDEREIADLLTRDFGSTPIDQCIVDTSGKIISHPDKSFLGTRLDSSLFGALTAGEARKPVVREGVVYLRYPLRGTGWSLVVSLPKSYLFSLSTTSVGGILLAMGIAALVSVIASILISRQLMRKLLIMSGVIRSITPRFKLSRETFETIDVRVPVPPEGVAPDVLDELAIAFNALVDKLNGTMQNALTSSLAHEKLRYQLLRTKINPHFLYNILDSIKICNTLGRTDDANQMLSRLAAFYRLILRKNDLDIIPIGEELEIIKLYLEMEAISHEHSFTYTLEIDPDIEFFSIPRFVLQPLVENCVTHGLPGDAKCMTIAISLRYVGDAIRIVIRDNGLGIPPQQMERLMRVIHGEAEPLLPGGHPFTGGTAFYGLHNISERLKPYVMNPAEPISCQSAPGLGTRVTIDLRQMLPDNP